MRNIKNFVAVCLMAIFAVPATFAAPPVHQPQRNPTIDLRGRNEVVYNTNNFMGRGNGRINMRIFEQQKGHLPAQWFVRVNNHACELMRNNQMYYGFDRKGNAYCIDRANRLMRMDYGRNNWRVFENRIQKLEKDQYGFVNQAVRIPPPFRYAPREIGKEEAIIKLGLIGATILLSK